MSKLNDDVITRKYSEVFEMFEDAGQEQSALIEMLEGTTDIRTKPHPRKVFEIIVGYIKIMDKAIADNDMDLVPQAGDSAERAKSMISSCMKYYLNSLGSKPEQSTVDVLADDVAQRLWDERNDLLSKPFKEMVEVIGRKIKHTITDFIGTSVEAKELADTILSSRSLGGDIGVALPRSNERPDASQKGR